MKTRLDHWLTNLSLRHEVRCIQLPKLMPACVGRPIPIRDNAQGWRWLVHCPNDRTLEVLLAALKLDRRGYTLDTFNRKDWWARLLNPRGQSLTYNMLWGGLKLGCLGWGAFSLAVKFGVL
jgi:hypothetical protein